MQITSYQAQAIIEGAEEKARELGLPVTIVVLDIGARLKALRRMDGAVPASIDIAMRKAFSAVLFEANSEAVWVCCKPGASAPAGELANASLSPFSGGIPVRGTDGYVIGALGISGGTVAQDVQVAQAGFSAFQALTS